MHLQALRFGPDRTDGPVSVHLTIETVDDLVKLRQDGVPRVFVVRLKDLDRLKRLKGAALDLGEKDARIQLARYFLDVRDDCIPLLQGTYTSVPQSKRGIRAFLAKAGAGQKQNIYFLGVTDALFDGLLLDEERNRQKAASAERSRKKPAPSTARKNGKPSPYAAARALLREEPVPPEVEKCFVGTSPEAEEVRQLIVLASKNLHPVLLQGETGTGKNVAALAIHKLTVENQGRKKELVTADLASISSTLIASELFGHLRGAFTGADSDRAGLFMAADGGTIFLDEIGELPLENQKALLRAVDAKKVRALGSDREVDVDVRIIAATNRDLFGMVQRKLFREDLYWRLRGIMIRTPALRDHPEDIPVLAQLLWKKVVGREDAPALPDDILNGLMEYRWMGNARRLKSVLISLNSWYGDTGLRRKHLTAVMQFFEEEVAPDRRTGAKNPIDAHRIACLQHLQRVDEAVSCTKVALRLLSADKQTAAANADALQESVAERIRDLDKLCRKPSLFYSSDTFQTVYQLKGNLTFLQDLLPEKIIEARKYYAKDLKAHFGDAVAAICEEIQHVLADYDRTTHDAPYEWMVCGT